MPAIITRGAASAKAFGWSGGGGICCTTYGERFYVQTCNDYPDITYSWVAPAGVFHVSVVTVGAGATQGGGGGLGYKNNYAVNPGNSYSVRVGGYNGRCSYFVSTCIVKGGGGVINGAGGTYTGDGGGNGGAYSGCKGGGAGGYAGNGNSGTGGAAANGNGTNAYGGAGGGGVSIFGQGTSATANTGAGGSSGTAGGVAYNCGGCYCCPPIPYSECYGGTPGIYGGGSGRGNTLSFNGGRGAVRIIYPGNARSFPSTNAGQLNIPFIYVGASPGSVTVPVGATKLKAEVISQSNGCSNNGAAGTGGSGGGGGAYASTSCLSVTAGNLVYIFVDTSNGTTAIKSWINKTTNAAPTSSANGAAATSAVLAAGGSSGTSIGTVTYSGGNGGVRGSSPTYMGGGGGGSASPCGAGANGGAAYSGAGYSGAGGGGGAGGSAAAAGNTGTVSAGGAGGAGGSVGTGGAGATVSSFAVAGVNGGGGGGGFSNSTYAKGKNGGEKEIWSAINGGYVYGAFGGSGGRCGCKGGQGGSGGRTLACVPNVSNQASVILTFST